MSIDETSNKWQQFNEEQEEATVTSIETEEQQEGQMDTEIEQEAQVDAPTAVLEHPSYKALEDKLTKSEQQAHDSWEQKVRAQAELENVRRRAKRDVEQAHRYGSEKLIKEFLPVMDSLEQAIQAANALESDEAKAMLEGLNLTMQLMTSSLQKSGVEVIDPKGEAFNPEHHEAMSMLPSDAYPSNHVLDVFQKGYSLHGRVLRPARVIVVKN